MPEQYPVKKNPSTQVLSQFSKPYPDIQVDPVVLWEYGATKHICLSSIGCRFGRGGQCVYCNYGSTTEHSDEEKLRAVENILQTNIHKRVIVGSFGNYFDPEEVSWELFSSINGLLARTAIGSIIFETHYTTVSKKYLDEIKRVFSPTNKDIFIEMGLESSNPRILKEYINKSLDIRKFSDTIALIKEYGFGVIANVILGTPYLTPEQQLDDAYATINWALNNKADGVVVFPLNVKENTPLYKLCQEGVYKPISQWLLIRLLDLLDETLLSRVSMSWFGERQEKGRDLYAIPPGSCPICREKLQEFYRDYSDNPDGKYRREILDELINPIENCDCPRELGFDLAER